MSYALDAQKEMVPTEEGKIIVVSVRPHGIVLTTSDRVTVHMTPKQVDELISVLGRARSFHAKKYAEDKVGDVAAHIAEHGIKD
jgi:hypothetical protein